MNIMQNKVSAEAFPNSPIADSRKRGVTSQLGQ